MSIHTVNIEHLLVNLIPLSVEDSFGGPWVGMPRGEQRALSPLHVNFPFVSTLIEVNMSAVQRGTLCSIRFEVKNKSPS
jgi:hypothetical protein